MEHFANYCLECEWAASTENHSRNEQAELVIEHFVTTGHAIDGDRRTIEEPAMGWADDWPPSDSD